MKIVNDKIYLNTIKRVKKLIKIDKNSIKYKKKVLINLMPTFGFKQLIIFIRLGEYLKKEGFWVDYFGCNGVFNHCDMVKMNDEVDRKLICERCILADKKLNIPFIDIKFSKSTKYNKKYLKNSLIRFCGDEIKFKTYKKESKQNLKIASSINLQYDFLISLNHFQHYSIAPLIDSFENKLFLNIAGNWNNKLNIFAGDKKIVLEQNLDFDNKKLKQIEKYFKNRLKLNNSFQINTNKKIISFFPNLLQDAFEGENDMIFNSMLEWLKESVKFAIKQGYFVVIKAHPSETYWKPTKSVIDYFEENENLMLIPANSKIGAYDIIDKSEFVSVYNGTIFYESLVWGKKVILGGKIGTIYHKSKKEYFEQFINYKKYDYKKAMEYGYKILWTKSFNLNMIDEKLPYPYIKKEITKEIAFEAIKDIIENRYDVNKYIPYFVAQY